MNERKHHIDIIFIIVLFAVFAVSSAALALLGVNIYKTTTASSDDELNTAALYFAQQVRQCEDKSMIRVANLDGDIPALGIGEVTNGTKMETWLFVKDGVLKEVTVADGSEVDPAYGQEVMDLDAITFTKATDTLLQITMTSTDGTTDTLNLSLIGGGDN